MKVHAQQQPEQPIGPYDPQPGRTQPSPSPTLPGHAPLEIPPTQPNEAPATDPGQPPTTVPSTPPPPGVPTSLVAPQSAPVSANARSASNRTSNGKTCASIAAEPSSFPISRFPHAS